MTTLQGLLDEGLAAGLYSGSAAGVWRESGREFAFAGTHAYGDAAAVGPTSVFDLASISKTFTAAVLLKLEESGVLSLDDRVASVMPVSSGEGASEITLRMLLTHTAGLPDVSFLWRDSPGIAPEERLGAVIATPLQSAPGSEYRYSCIGYVAAAAYAERVTATPFRELLATLVTRPLALASVGYGPVEATIAVATEEEPWAGRGLVRGEVHDETSWYLGGVSGNAGLFGTVADVLTFAHSYVDGAVLGPSALHQATSDQLPDRMDAPHRQGIGPWMADHDIFGDVDAYGHPGFTGTLWLVIPETGTAAVLLTNRVHPSRERVDLDPFRRRFAAWAAER